MLDLERLCKARQIPCLSGGGHHHARAGWIQLHCPQCGTGEGGWHLGFSLERGNFHCWRCGPIKVSKAVAGLLRLHSWSEIHNVLQSFQTDRRIWQPRGTHNRPQSIQPPPELVPLPLQHRNYLRRRGFDPDKLVAEWGLMGTQHLSGIWNWRVVYPICDESGQIVAYQGRAIAKDAQPRYRMSDEKDIPCDPKSLLYGIHRVVGDGVLIVEGAPSIWRLGPGAVATLGTGWKAEQARRLRQYKRRYVLFDPEPEAQQRANELAAELSLYGGTVEVITGFDVDPGDFTDAQAKWIMDELGLQTGRATVM